MRAILEIIAAIILLIWGTTTKNDGLSPELIGMGIGFLITFAMEILIWAYENRNLMRLYISILNPRIKNEIRLTIAYLYKIEVNGRYLLVKSNRIENAYQPVGGVYKYFHPEADCDLRDIGVTTDNHITNDEDSEFDLRLMLDSKFNLRKFLKWFLDKKQRELDPWREFYEELVAPGILPGNIFEYIHYELIGQHYMPLHYDRRLSVDTFKYVDIYKPKFVNNAQSDIIKQLVNTPSTEYIWATKEEIIAQRTATGIAITEQSKKIFHNKKLN